MDTEFCLNEPHLPCQNDCLLKSWCAQFTAQESLTGKNADEINAGISAASGSQEYLLAMGEAASLQMRAANMVARETGLLLGEAKDLIQRFCLSEQSRRNK